MVTNKIRIDNDKPSQNTSAYFIYSHVAWNYPSHTIRGGKWMIFVPISQVDETWDRVKNALHLKLLGDTAKVSTMRPNRHAMNQNDKLICVYTYDALDIDDVKRIRENLRMIGFTQLLRYKTDEATLQNQYSVFGFGKTTLYQS